MQLLSIENLSLAAEVTVVLLLLAFAWPQQKTADHESPQDSESISWEPVQFFFLQDYIHRGLYLNQWRTQLQSRRSLATSKPYQPPANEENEHSKIPAPWQDRLTHLINRQGFDAILKAWLSIDSHHCGASCVSMISLSTYSELTSAHGAIVTEQAVQRIGMLLSSELSHDSLIARYLPDRFAVLHFASSTAASHQAMARVYEKTLNDTFFQAAGESLPLPCNVSILGIESESDLISTMDLLEEGVSESLQSSRAVVSRQDGDWTDMPVAFEASTTDNARKELDSHSGHSRPKSSTSSVSLNENAAPELPADSPSVEANVKQSNVEENPSADNDISAVASPDDIAALFAQINTQKSGATASAPSPSVEKAKPPEPKAVPNVEVPDASEAATADDIAALFATIKPNANKPNTSKPDASKSNTPSAAALPVQPASPIPTITETESSEAASADDIAALFASIKPNTNAAPVAPIATPAANKAPASEAPKPSADVDPTEVASADDIAALFASVQPTAKPAAKADSVAAPAASPSVAKTPPKETAKSLPDIDPNEAASADDIAALFATISPATKATVPAPTAASPVAAKSQPIETAKPIVDLDPTEAASADDIAALFATINPATKAAVPTPSAASPVPAKAQPIETAKPLADVDPTEAASADDIAALFATIKPASKAAAPVAPPAPPVADKTPAIATTKAVESIDPNETATADDIAALFATVKPAAKLPTATPPTPASAPAPSNAKAPAPVTAIASELSEVATADDIASLFATVKTATPAPAQPSLPSKPTPPAVPFGEELNEAASSDDIAALFASIKPVGATNSAATASPPAKPAAKALPIPEEELSATASLDDIEALFAAMKK